MMNPTADFQSGHDRRHNDPPNLWLAVLAGSLAVHLLLLLSGRLFLFRINSQKSAGVAAPIELITLSPKSSSKAAQSTRSVASKVVTAPAAAQQQAVSSDTVSQRAAPIQPSIVQQPVPKQSSQPSIVQQPTPRPTPQIKPTIASTPKPSPLPLVKVRPVLAPVTPEQPPFPNSEPLGADANDRPISPDANPIASPGSADPDNNPSAVPNSSADDSGREPSTPGPAGSDQTLSSASSVESKFGQVAKAGEFKNSSKSATLQGDSTQTLPIQFPPALGLAPNQVIDLTVLVVIDNERGTVLSTKVLPDESKAFQQIPGLNQGDIESVVNRIFRDLTFKVEVESGPDKGAPQSPWKVPVSIRVK